MRNSRFTTEQIIGFIKQAEAGMAVIGDPVAISQPKGSD